MPLDVLQSPISIFTIAWMCKLSKNSYCAYVLGKKDELIEKTFICGNFQPHTAYNLGQPNNHLFLFSFC